MADDPDLVPLGPSPNPPGAFRPSVGYAGDNGPSGDPDLQPLNSKPKSILNTSYEKVPTFASGGKEWGDYFGRKLGLGTRETIEGASSLGTQALDVATWPARAAQRAFGIQTDAPSTLRDRTLDLTGLPQPQTPEEQRNAEVVRGGAAMLTPMGVGAIAPRTAEALPAMIRPFVSSPQTTGPLAAAQVAAGGVGAGAGDALANREEVPDWLKPTARVVGNIAGAGLTSGVTGAIDTLVNAAKGVPSDIAAALARLGIKPTTMGAVTDRPGIQGTEATFTRAPVSSGMLQPQQRQMVDQFGDAVEGTAARLDPATGGRIVTAQDAGKRVQDLLQDWRTNTFQKEQDAAWAPLDQRMAGTAVDPAPYRTALEYAASPPGLASLPENQRAFASAQAKKWLDALNADVPPGGKLSWEQAQAIKRRIGDAMGTPEIVGSIGSQQLKNIYGGLADSIKQTAVQHGQGNLFNEANAVTTAGHQFIDGTVSQAIQKTNLGQETIRPDDAANNLLRDNTALQQLRDRVPEAADALAAYRLRSMQQAVPSQQGDVSTGSFLTNLRRQQRSDPEGTAALFTDPTVQQNVKDLTTTANQFRGVEKNMNAPNTAVTSLLLSLGGQLAAGYGLGGARGVGGVLAGNLGAPYVAGKFLTNPALIKLMAAQPGASTPMSGRVAGLLGAAATMPQDQRP